MANVLFYGDLHAGHKAIAKYRTQFRDEQDHFEHVEREYYNAVTKRDVCYFTGDAVFSLERARQIAKWPGKKILICGNHDTDNLTIPKHIEPLKTAQVQRVLVVSCTITSDRTTWKD